VRSEREEEESADQKPPAGGRLGIAQGLYKNKENSIADIYKALKVSRATLYRSIKTGRETSNFKTSKADLLLLMVMALKPLFVNVHYSNRGS
jgi:hypothetical protein